jgi:hypothetical protein
MATVGPAQGTILPHVLTKSFLKMTTYLFMLQYSNVVR